MNSSAGEYSVESIQQKKMQSEEPVKKTDILISGLDCGNCAAKLEKKVASMKGVHQATLVFASGKMTIEHTVPVSLLLQTIQESGYKGRVVQGAMAKPEESSMWKETRTQMTIASGVILAAAFTMNRMGVGREWMIPMYLASMIIGGYHVVRIGLFSLRALVPDMNLLMTIAAIGAAAIGEWNEAAVVVFLFSLGNSLQAFSMDRTRRSVRALMELAPQEALVIREGSEFILPVEALSVGDFIRVKPGERIPMDGTVASGFSSVDQAPVTGESVPVDKDQGDEVFAGTVNGTGSLTIEVTRLAKDNTIGRIMHLVEEAQAQKAPSQQFVDVFARYYTPAVIIGAVALVAVPVLLLGLPFTPWFYKALVLLVISCPCALVISTPVSIVSAIGNASRQGLLIKGGAYLEELGRIRAVAFDKTGTLTEGRLMVEDVVPADSFTTDEVVALAAAVERYSEHPAARAIVEYSQEQGMVLQEVSHFESQPGIGVSAKAGDSQIRVVSTRHLEDHWAELVRIQHCQGRTVAVVIKDETIAGIIALADKIRTGSNAALDHLREAGIDHMVMLTGDHQAAAKVVADKMGIDDVRAGLLPEEKVEAVKEIRETHRRVAMVGDGVNDAPALAAATVGIAMGAAGTDAALETADVALMSDDLSKLAFGLRLGRQALKIIKQNIVFSIAIKAVFLALTFMGVANLWMAVFADTGAALLVIFNGMRLMAYRDQQV